MEAAPTTDRRVERTKRAIVRAFVGLLFDRRYDEIKVADIVLRADVGRSTFYQHYRGKDDVLQDSMAWVLEILADAVMPGADDAKLRAAVDHMWGNRRLGRVVFAPPIGLSVRRSLAGLIDARLGGEDAPLRAVQIAAAQIAVLEAWAKGDVTATQDQIVARLRCPG